MASLDWTFVGYALYVPFLIGVYAIENVAIFKYRKEFNSSFHRIFSVLSVVNILACVLVTFMFRLPIYPMVNNFYAGLGTPSAWLTVVRVGVYYLCCLSEFLGVLLAFNRFSALHFITAHDKFWRRFLPLSIIFCIFVAIAPIWHIIDDSVSFRKSPDPTFSWYYTVVVSARPAVSVWFHMLIVTIVCNVLSFLLYGACFVRFCMYSVARNYTVERNFFLVGILSMLFSLPFAATMLFLGINLAPGGSGVASETLISVSFQVPWLTDLKFLSPAPILIVTNSSIRNAMRRMLFPSNQIAGYSQNTLTTQIISAHSYHNSAYG